MTKETPDGLTDWHGQPYDKTSGKPATHANSRFTGAVESPIGWMPRFEDMDWTGIEGFSKEDFAKIMTVDREPRKQELMGHELFAKLYDKLSKEFYFMRELLLSALWRSPEHWQLEPEHI